jgi:2-amino-4-hydroxy-6-hydroxymethyldihydropteridine diphosphokinase
LTRAYVGLGANLGPREVTILRAVDLLGATPGIEVLELSQLRETDPVGVTDQPAFLNGAVGVDTTLSPRQLLDELLRIERELGRVRDGERWGPRTIDLDLLVYGDHRVDEPGLTVPHPRLADRPFALEPLAELDPALEIPGRGRVADLLRGLQSA